MYIPTGARNLSEVKEQQIRLGIQGYGGTGKTTFAVGYSKCSGFPNPIVVNLDRGLGAFTGREDIIEVPLYNDDYCKIVNPNHKGPTTLRDTIKFWIEKEAKKLQADQTLIWDGGTGIQNCYHKWYTENRVFSAKTGKPDDWAEWNLKITFFTDLVESFKTLKCHVVYISHEADKKDKDGSYTGKIRPLLSGSFNDQIVSYFTDWVRALTCDKPDPEKMEAKSLAKWGMNKEEFALMLTTFPRNTLYYLQLESDDIFDGKISSLVNYPRYIPSHFANFQKYMKNKTND